MPITEGKKTQFYIGTRNILFVAVGAFSKNKPSDLIVEVQGRLPNKVEVKPLTKEDYVRILRDTKDSLIAQVVRSIKTEGIFLDFTEKGIQEIAEVAEEINKNDEDTGARRLVAVLDTVLEDISFEAPDIYRENYQIGKKLM